jgi:hypothetical protein
VCLLVYSSIVVVGGPEDDIRCIYWIVPVLLIFTATLIKEGVAAVLSCLLSFALVVALLLLFRHHEVLRRPGYGPWHAQRSLESLYWFLAWLGPCVALGSWLARRRQIRHDE